MPIYRNSVTWAAMFGVIALMFVKLPPMVAKQDSVLNTYSALVEVNALAQQRFVDSISGDRLAEGAIRGMLRQLDPYSGYISPEELPGFQRRSRGQFCGVGLEIGMRDGALTVIAPIEGSSAARAGVLAGDQIVSVDGKEVDQLSAFEVEEMLVGPPGTTLALELQSHGATEARKLLLTRESISLRTVRGISRLEDGSWNYWLDREGRIAYIRVSNFRDQTITEFDEVLAGLRGHEPKALVLDLRFNPGGLLHQAVAMADRFLSDGLIISTVNRRSVIDEYRAEKSPVDLDVPLVVLMNGASASSSEIVAGALQARGRARVVGQRSFGKGSVQHLIQLVGLKAAVKLTVAYYRLPDGRIIHRTQHGRGLGEAEEWGVEPDVEVILTPEESHRLQEARRVMDSPREGAASMAAQQASLSEDRQLQIALNIARSSTASSADK